MAAYRAASPLRRRRTAYGSRIWRRSRGATKVPWRGWISKRPSRSRRRIASRTGVDLSLTEWAYLSVEMASPAASELVRIPRLSLAYARSVADRAGAGIEVSFFLIWPCLLSPYNQLTFY